MRARRLSQQKALGLFIRGRKLAGFAVPPLFRTALRPRAQQVRRAPIGIRDTLAL